MLLNSFFHVTIWRVSFFFLPPPSTFNCLSPCSSGPELMLVIDHQISLSPSSVGDQYSSFLSIFLSLSLSLSFFLPVCVCVCVCFTFLSEKNLSCLVFMRKRQWTRELLSRSLDSSWRFWTRFSDGFIPTSFECSVALKPPIKGPSSATELPSTDTTAQKLNRAL